jgi:Family of unknown function (DUF5682)
VSVTVLGIRHHGPGSARAVRAALARLAPDAILIEGPPEADQLLPLAAHEGMRPPVALLAYVPGKPSRSAFWPFAVFSPEWQAILHGLRAGVPVRFCDLPAAHSLADDLEASEEDGSPAGTLRPGEPPGEGGARAEGPPGDAGNPGGGERPAVRVDPLGWLAEAAGYDDAERWWDDVIEHRGFGGLEGEALAGEPAPFEAIAEAMAALRQHAPPPAEREAVREARREAHMRKVLRETLRQGYQRVAVVCGAWHVPALAELGPAAPDVRTLRGMPKVKVAATWVPWTHGRLAAWTGYGAGVRSPGWYHHLFEAPDRPVERWLAEAARVLRQEDIPVSSAHVIEAVRLAQALAALRGRPLAGLGEVTEATRAVLCEGSDLAVELVQRRLVVGERLGAVPPATPMVPLQRDLQAEQRGLHLQPRADQQEHDLDLRRPLDVQRSRMLHRLRLLGVPWGSPQGTRGRGTFHELWVLAWSPELDLALIEASAWGTTVAAAAVARARSLVSERASLADLTTLAERCLLADLPDALPEVMAAVSDRAALDSDVTHLMAALPALVRAIRYGDVRGTDAGALRTAVNAIAVRVCVGLAPAVGGLDDDAARELLGHIDEVHAALGLLGDPDHRRRLHDALAGIAGRDDLHGLIDGRVTRLLLDAGRLTPGEVARRMARSVSIGVPAARVAAWVEGFLGSSGLLLVHDAGLLGLVDEWITGLPADSFSDVLPLLRRTFGAFPAPERRAIGERARRSARGGTGRAAPEPAEELDLARAAAAVRTVATILGLEEIRAPEEVAAS